MPLLRFLPLAVSLLAAVAAAADQPALPPEPVAALRVNTVGFRPDAPKVASVAGAAAGADFRVRAAEGDAVVLGGKLAAAPASASGEDVQFADFSALVAPGRYVLEVEGAGRTAAFRVADDVWSEAFRAVARGMYLWRCGTAVHGEWDGKTFQHAACHLEDGLLDYVGGPAGARRASNGGWHDAGDYNKYVVNAGFTVGMMFKAWEQFRPRLERVRLDLPESGNGTPDLLNELRWEFDWLFTMQAEDGRVYHKVSALNFSYGGPAEADRSPRYYVPWSTTATADFVAMMALGAQHFREFDAAYADRCLAAARRGWAFLLAHPENHEAEQKEFRTGGYGAPDPSHRLWAAIELFETTGEPEFVAWFEQRARGLEFNFGGPGWYDVKEIAFGTYLLSRHPAKRDAAFAAGLQHALVALCERVVAVAATDPHGRPLGNTRGVWYWGGNGTVASQTYLLHVADRLAPNLAYRATAQHALAFLFGRNFHGRSYVTGVGANPPLHPHDRRGEPAWPGYLVGGPWPTGRDWIDRHADYRTNEIAINWNAALIYALAPFLEPAPAAAK